LRVSPLQEIREGKREGPTWPLQLAVPEDHRRLRWLRGRAARRRRGGRVPTPAPTRPGADGGCLQAGAEGERDPLRVPPARGGRAPAAGPCGGGSRPPAACCGRQGGPPSRGPSGGSWAGTTRLLRGVGALGPVAGRRSDGGPTNGEGTGE
jgi:hypothetical protein